MWLTCDFSRWILKIGYLVNGIHNVLRIKCSPCGEWVKSNIGWWVQRSRHNNTYCPPISQNILRHFLYWFYHLCRNRNIRYRFISATFTLFSISRLHKNFVSLICYSRYADFNKTQYFPYCQSLYLCKLSLYDTVCGKKMFELRRVLMRTVFPLKTQKSVAFCRETHTAGFEQTKATFPTKKKNQTGFAIFGKAPRIYDNGSNKRAKFTARWIWAESA